MSNLSKLPFDDPARLSRRTILAAGAVGAAALLAPGRLRALVTGRQGFGGPPEQPPAVPGPTKLPKPFHRRMPIPREITDAQINLPIVEADIGVLPGRKTTMWTYDGSFPGPTIRRPAGAKTRVTFEHQLPPKAAGELTVHLHGGHNTSRDDGQPGGLTEAHPRSLYCDISPSLSPRESGNDLLIAPGERRTYNYEGTEDGQPIRGAMKWYHDHRLDRTARHVWRGLAGVWIVEDEYDRKLSLPRDDRDIPIVIADRSFNRENRLTDPFDKFAHAPNDETVGDFILVNGQIAPYHPVKACTQRLRILNASNFSSYNLAFGDGVPVTQIGTEAGLMPKPLRRRRVLVGPGERVDLIVDFSNKAGEAVVMRSVKRPKGPPTKGSKAFDGPLMQFRVGAPVPDDTRIPRNLRPLPYWVKEASSKPTHTWQIGIGGGGFLPSWQINKRTFDPSYADAKPEIDTTVTWKLVNTTAVAHMMHLHHTDWYLISRNGHKPPRHERCLKDTYFMDPHEEIVIAGRLSDHLGKFVVHCHMLDHEDHGLMSQFEVVPKKRKGGAGAS